MSLSIGIVGLPNVGKSTLFNALLKRQAALAASYPFATIDPNVGIVGVPDDRIFRIEKIVKKEFGDKIVGDCPKKITPATVKFIDIAGLVKGASEGEGLGNQFLAHIREVDAILHVVRGFEDVNVSKAGSTTPPGDIDLIKAELLLADLNSIEKRLGLIKDLKMKKFLTEVKNRIEKGEVISAKKYSDDENRLLKELSLLTTKPFLYAINVGEEFLGEEYDPMFIKICAKLEADLVSFGEAEKEDYLREIGVENVGLDVVIKRSYELLDLHSFFTSGPDEIRAWTIKKGTKAKQAAGEIHTDLERGFISAEVITIDKLEEAGTWKQAKDLGQVRLEGKEYVVQDGDIMIVRFNV